MAYRLGKHSKRELKRVHPGIVAIVKRAIKITEVDFIVFDGFRTKQEQRKLVLKGVSKTNNSFHRYGLAVDLVPINSKGHPDWSMTSAFREINRAVKVAMNEENMTMIDNGQDLWGWDAAHWQLHIASGADGRAVYRNKKDIGF